MSTQQLQDYTFYTKYARYDATKRRRETYPEAVQRVIDMHRQKYAGIDLEDILPDIHEAMLHKRVLGSQRALQFGGVPILQKNARIYNCSASFCDRTRFFQEAMWLLLCGCGVGFSVQRHHVALLPSIRRPDPANAAVFEIPDTIEGWADALGVLLSSYFVDAQPFPEYAGKAVVFDYTKIRPEGAPLANGVGKAPGPKPLERSLEHIRALLDRLTVDARCEYRLRPIDAYDIVMHASNAVLSGGVRRSATICIFSPDDYEMATAKTGNWFVENPQRARSNNSALLLRHSVTLEQFSKLMHSVREFGEPGFVWADDTEIVFNPCCEISLYPVDIETGESGWQFCNLCEINMKACRTPDEFYQACRVAAWLGTLQAGYTNLTYLGPVSERITTRESLLGVSMTGMMDNPRLSLNPVVLERGAEIVKEENRKLAQRLGIPVAARCTCVKPAGTTSCLLGTASGIHPHHAKRYFRRVRVNTLEPVAQFYMLHNPRSAEKSVWSSGDRDYVLSFCITAPDGALTRRDVSALQLLENVRIVQKHWVKAGRNPDRCVKPYLCHNVSNTITVRDDEWYDVTLFIYANREYFTGISLLPSSGDLDYPQAPFTEVLTESELHALFPKHAARVREFLPAARAAFQQNVWNACECLQGRGVRAQPGSELHGLQERWLSDVRDFVAQTDFDIKSFCVCLKHWENLELWAIISSSEVPVDYTLLREDSDQTTIAETVACAGGSCELV